MQGLFLVLTKLAGNATMWMAGFFADMGTSLNS